MSVELGRFQQFIAKQLTWRPINTMEIHERLQKIRYPHTPEATAGILSSLVMKGVAQLEEGGEGYIRGEQWDRCARKHRWL